ncbi:MAG: tyrosine-type recombinase/integrase [Acidimicrobiales bacterium]
MPLVSWHRPAAALNPSLPHTHTAGRRPEQIRAHYELREKVIRPALVAAGLPETIRTYDLRHSHASLLIDVGANVLAVSQRMGHSDPAVTLREYGHLFEGVQAHLTQQLDGLRMATAKSTPSAASIVPMEGARRTRAGHTGHAKDTRNGSEKVKTGRGR